MPPKHAPSAGKTTTGKTTTTTVKAPSGAKKTVKTTTTTVKSSEGGRVTKTSTVTTVGPAPKPKPASSAKSSGFELLLTREQNVFKNRPTD